jgi:hypothetical protein
MSRKYKQFDQYQQNEPYPLTSNLWTQKQTTTYDIGNAGPVLEQEHICEGSNR